MFDYIESPTILECNIFKMSWHWITLLEGKLLQNEFKCAASIGLFWMNSAHVMFNLLE